MPKDPKRKHRIESLLQKEIMQIVEHHLRDDKLQMININAVALNGDLSVAYVYFTVIGNFEQANTEQQQHQLNKSAPFIRKKVMQNVYLKRMPRLIFKFDASIKNARHIDTMLSKVLNKQ